MESRYPHDVGGFPGVRQVELILGPPGTGKTQAIASRIRAEIDTGTPRERIAIVSFTRAAVRANSDRLESSAGDPASMESSRVDGFDWARTVHAMGYKLLGLKAGRVMGAEHWSQFAERYHYELGDVIDQQDRVMMDLSIHTADDELRYVVAWAANQRLDLNTAHRLCPVTVDGPQLRLFAKRLISFKSEKSVYDFADVLEKCLEKALTPPVDAAFIDEAQDLSPLQIACVEMWFASCSRVVIAGDDDQCIYGFQGADPSWLLSLANRYPTTKLNQSFRLPGAVHDLALQLVSRNCHRVAKQYQPAAHQGEVVVIDRDRLPDLLDGAMETFVLARNRHAFVRLTHELLKRQVPYLVEGSGGICPLRDPLLVDALRAAVSISREEKVSPARIAAMSRFISPGSVDKAVRDWMSEQESTDQGSVPDEFVLQRIGDLIRSIGPVEALGRVSKVVRAYLTALLEDHGCIPAPRIRVMTIHASKGREADQVVILPNLGRNSYRELHDDRRGGREAEQRVAYVAVTRARTRLVLVRPTSRRFFPYEGAWLSVVKRRSRE